MSRDPYRLASQEPPRPPDERRPQCEVSCLRCAAVLAVTERIADAEMRAIVDHLCGCIPDISHASERPTFDEVFRLIRVRNR